MIQTVGLTPATAQASALPLLVPLKVWLAICAASSSHRGLDGDPRPSYTPKESAIFARGLRYALGVGLDYRLGKGPDKGRAGRQVDQFRTKGAVVPFPYSLIVAAEHAETVAKVIDMAEAGHGLKVRW